MVQPYKAVVWDSNLGLPINKASEQSQRDFWPLHMSPVSEILPYL